MYLLVGCSASKIEMNSMVEDTEEEKFFRDRYANELKKKKQDSRGDELDDERRKVKAARNENARKERGANKA